MKIYVIRDSKAQTCGTNLMVFRNDGEAIRSVQQAMGNQETMLSKFPEDYALFSLGNYEEETGSIQLEEQKRHIIDVLELVKE